jgi:hypothetical protein
MLRAHQRFQQFLEQASEVLWCQELELGSLLSRQHFLRLQDYRRPRSSQAARFSIHGTSVSVRSRMKECWTLVFVNDTLSPTFYAQRDDF